MAANLSIAELAAAARRYQQIDGALSALNACREKLSVLRAHVKATKATTISAHCTIKATTRGGRNFDAYLDLPVGIFLQAQIDICRRAERTVVQLGGVVPLDPYQQRERVDGQRP